MSKRSLREYIDLLKEEISSRSNPVVRIGNNQLVYVLREKRSRDISTYNVNTLGELGRALAILDLVEKYNVPKDLIFIEERSIVGSPSRRIDIKIQLADVYKERECIALIECKTSTDRISDSEFTNYFIKQLYNIAHAYAKDPKQPYPLVLIAYEITISPDKKIDIFYKWFLYPEIEKSVDTGQISLGDIISRHSTFGYDTPPKVLQDKVYFYKKTLTKNDLIDINNPNQLKHLLKEKLHQTLRQYGIVEDNAFNTIVNLLLAKSYDEIQLSYKKDKETDFQVKPEDYLHKNTFYNRIKNLLENALIQLLGMEAKEARNEEILYHEEKEKILLELVPYLQRIRLRSLKFIGEDSLGDIFLDFMHSIFRQSRGLFFTHPNICRFVCKAVNIQKVAEDLKNGDYKYILDPSCGSGTFLIEALRLIFKDYQIDEIKSNALKLIFGIDNEPNATKLCKVNMVIHGDGSANIYNRNALEPLRSLPLPFIREEYILREQECTFETLKEGHGVDFIITNPPFSLEIKQDQYNHFRMKKFLTFRRGVSYASECLFIERWYQLLNPKGRLGAVLPASIFESNEYLKPRLLFLCYFKIKAIVGLPEYAFSPHARQRTLLVFAERRPLDESNNLFRKIDNIEEFIKVIGKEKLLFYDAKNIGYTRMKVSKTVSTIDIGGNELTDERANIIAKAFEGNYSQTDPFVVKSLEEIYNENKSLILTPNFFQSLISLETFKLEETWEVVEIEKVKNTNIDLLLCETGDIISDAGVITPKNLNSATILRKERIKKKLKNGKFGTLKEGDIIIAPVRVYQKKIAVVTKNATKFLFSKDFIVLRRKTPDLKESFKLFLTLKHDLNIKQLERLSTTGKSGYPKIKNPKAILQIDFYKVDIPEEKIEKLINLYDEIYEHILSG